MALGLFKLGNLIRFIPYPVIGGFLAGAGWLLVRGAFSVMIGSNPSLSDLPSMLAVDMLIKWLPGLLLAVLLLLILRRHNHYMIVHGLILDATGLFYLVLRLLGISLAQASA